MPRRGASAASVGRDRAGIIPVEVMLAAVPVGAASSGLPNPNEFMEEQ